MENRSLPVQQAPVAIGRVLTRHVRGRRGVVRTKYSRDSSKMDAFDLHITLTAKLEAESSRVEDVESLARFTSISYPREVVGSERR